jgi:hypothetical protein
VIKERGHIDMLPSLESYCRFWRKAKEKTSCYPGPLSFATLKAGASDPLLAAFECSLTGIPLKGGFAPRRWKQMLDVMILKKAGITTLPNLRIIVLFHPDCNYAFKHVGRVMMKTAEEAGSLAPEQYGSRKNHRAIDLAVNKTLTYDVIRQLRRPCAICSNDARSCYDLIGHSQASLAMQRQGVSKSVVDCLFSTLQDALHQVRTSYGDSVMTYGGPKWLVPLHGIGQGNEAGPPIWAVVSTPLLQILRSKGFGCELAFPILRTSFAFSGFAFVDDTDIIESPLGRTSIADLAQRLQASVNTWEGTLKVGSYEDFFPVALVLEGKKPMDHNF